jgi:DNA helicase IV
MYGHIVVDEAQNLSPMALRMLARRSISGSMTLVGDLGQATSPAAPRSWADVVAYLPSRRPPRFTNLSVNYRTPAEIMTVADAVLSSAGVEGVESPRPVRSSGQLPEIDRVEGSERSAVAAAVAARAADEHRAVGVGTVAVIAPDAYLDDLAIAFDAASLPWGEPDRTGLTAAITLLSVELCRGLEFDSVVAVEPSAIVGESPQGLRALYVVLTRTTRRLAIVHRTRLPVELERGLEAAQRSLASGSNAVAARR